MLLCLQSGIALSIWAVHLERRMRAPEAVLAGMVLLAAAVCGAYGQLQLGYYAGSCPGAEEIVAEKVGSFVRADPTYAASLLRLHFHDCMVYGCDGSVLIKSTKGNRAEMAAKPNDSLRGFEFIESVKAALEEECPGVISCADIVALVARDAIGVIGGPHWSVPTGRRDGRISTEKAALANAPSPMFSFQQLLSLFQSKGLDLSDLVWLSGAHTVGVADCGAFGKRLYNYTGRGGAGDADPSLDREYAATLRKNVCKTDDDDDTEAQLDPGSHLTFDTHYYQLVLKRRGLLHSDGQLLANPAAREMVVGLAAGPTEAFFSGFAAAMEKLGKVEVKTGLEGEIRKQCSYPN